MTMQRPAIPAKEVFGERNVGKVDLCMREGGRREGAERSGRQRNVHVIGGSLDQAGEERSDGCTLTAEAVWGRVARGRGAPQADESADSRKSTGLRPQ